MPMSSDSCNVRMAQQEDSLQETTNLDGNCLECQAFDMSLFGLLALAKVPVKYTENSQ